MRTKDKQGLYFQGELKAKIKYNGKVIQITTISNPFNSWVLYRGEWYRNLR
jgi:hypothetical protein